MGKPRDPIPGDGVKRRPGRPKGSTGSKTRRQVEDELNAKIAVQEAEIDRLKDQVVELTAQLAHSAQTIARMVSVGDEYLRPYPFTQENYF